MKQNGAFRFSGQLNSAQLSVIFTTFSMQDVCSAWKAAAKDASLWQKLDMSRVKVTEPQLGRWARSGMLKRVREMNLSNFGPQLQHSTIVNIIEHCPKLEIISLAHNPKLSMETIEYIINHCENLRGVDISGTTKNRGTSNSSTCAPVVLKSLLHKHGKNLTQLCLSENRVASLNTVVNMVPVSCARSS